ncbi:MAG: serine/threonine-protein kinase [Xanthomonadales bacterium]|nr:serine/threonine-protein kinase [Xanthomonadales bacterium]
MSPSADQWDQLLTTGGGLLAGDEAEEDWSGKRLGAFQLEQAIGRGGMATVYLGQRVDDQFEQQVAVKILSERLHGESHQDRFRRERQILADLDHPFIARIIDGGVTENDLPYLVMEYVSGTPLDEYCDTRGLGAVDCLELVLKVCEAVQYAHSNLVIHQDLKPANILVNERGEPRLVDFGIASAGEDVDSDLRLFTPLYAAPEQLLGEKTSTATDCYQLGLLLYRLLCGTSPFAGGDLSDIRERVLNQPVPPVSSQARLPGSWRREADAIVARCLEKDPSRRYASVAELVTDLRAMLAGQPVSQLKDNGLYVAGKFLARNRGMLGAALVVMMLTAGGAGLYWQQMKRADISDDRADAVSELLGDILESVDPLAGGGVDSFTEVISTSGFEFSTARRYPPRIQREMVLMAGRTLMDLGKFDEVVRNLTPLVDEIGELEEPLPPRYAEYLSLLGYANYRNGDLQLGLDQLAEAMRRQRQQDDIAPEILASTLQRLGLAQRRAARPADARAHIEQANRLLVTALPDTDARVAQSFSHLGLVLADSGELDQAIQAYQRSAEIYARSPGDNQLRRAMTLGNLADAQRMAGDLEAAERNARSVVDLLGRASDRNPQLLATARITLGNTLMASDRYGEAVEQYSLAREAMIQSLGPEHPRVALIGHNLGSALRLSGDCASAIRYFDESLAIASRVYPADHPEIRETRRQRALCR